MKNNIGQNKKITIGLFGTCSNSKWRNRFIKSYQKNNINYFNPQLPKGTWKPEDAKIEADHLANDEIILFPVTNESYGLGSLSEVGFSILNAINLNKHRQFIIMIDKTTNNNLNDAELKKASNTARALVTEHLKKLNFENVYIVKSLGQMLAISKDLYAIEKLKTRIKEKLN
jgi:hypothetical protein